MENKEVDELKKELEQKNRELEIEASLERVRARTMAMQRSNELQDTAMLLFQQVEALGVPVFGCGFDYLGTNSFQAISEQLFKELKNFGKISNRQEWNQLQIKFLQNHVYHTPYALKHREPVKQQHLQDLIKNQTLY